MPRKLYIENFYSIHLFYGANKIIIVENEISATISLMKNNSKKSLQSRKWSKKKIIT